jgi:hypothetical protein
MRIILQENPCKKSAIVTQSGITAILASEVWRKGKYETNEKV